MSILTYSHHIFILAALGERRRNRSRRSRKPLRFNGTLCIFYGVQKSIAESRAWSLVPKGGLRDVLFGFVANNYLHDLRRLRIRASISSQLDPADPSRSIAAILRSISSRCESSNGIAS